MSQIYKSGSGSGPIPGGVLKLTPDLGVAVVPDINGNINVTGAPTGANQSVNDSNFETYNAGTSTMQVARRYQGSATTVGAVTSTVITIAVTVASVMNIEAQVAGIESTPLGVGGEVRGTVFRGGGGATLLGTPDNVVRASALLAAAAFTVNVSGNNLIVTVTGVAGRTIEWYVIADITQKSFI